MTSVSGLHIPAREDYVLCSPESSKQKLWDAIVVPRDVSRPVDAIQFTMVDSCDLVIEEFRKLFRLLPNRAFRFLMVRVVINQFELYDAQTTKMTWSLGTLSEEIEGFPGLVTWYECLWDFEDALLQYRREQLVQY
jgi:hypothetical protein